MTDPTASAVTVKLPTFWPAQPTIWFAQAEAQFALRDITSDSTKYYHVLAALDQNSTVNLAAQKLIFSATASRDGIKPNPTKVTAIHNLSRPAGTAIRRNDEFLSPLRPTSSRVGEAYLRAMSNASKASLTTKLQNAFCNRKQRFAMLSITCETRHQLLLTVPARPRCSSRTNLKEHGDQSRSSAKNCNPPKRATVFSTENC